MPFLPLFFRIKSHAKNLKCSSSSRRPDKLKRRKQWRSFIAQHFLWVYRGFYDRCCSFAFGCWLSWARFGSFFSSGCIRRDATTVGKKVLRPCLQGRLIASCHCTDNTWVMIRCVHTYQLSPKPRLLLRTLTDRSVFHKAHTPSSNIIRLF